MKAAVGSPIRPCVHECVHRSDDRAPPVLLVDGQLDLCDLSALHDLGGLGEVVREGLLAEQVLAALCEAPDQFELPPRWHGDVRNLHRGVAGDLVERAEHSPDAPPFGRSLRRRRIDVVAAHHVQPVRRVGRQVPVVGDPAAADDGDAVIVAIGEP